MLIKFPFNNEIIQKYLEFKQYYSPHDIDVINLLMKSIYGSNVNNFTKIQRL